MSLKSVIIGGGVAILLSCLASMVGCGGGGVGSSSSPVHQYSGTGSLDTGKAGNLSLTVAANGQVVGNYSVVSSPSMGHPRGGFVFPLGDYIVRGTTDSHGNYSLSGSIDGSTSFTITGTLPAGSSNQPFTVLASGTSFGGSLGPRVGSVEGWETLTFKSPDGSYNGLSSAVTEPQGTDLGVLSTDINGHTRVTAVFDTYAITFNPDGTDRSCGLFLQTDETVQEGMSIPITTQGTGDYFETDWQAHVQIQHRAWTMQSGNIVIDSIDRVGHGAGSFTFHGEVVLVPDSSQGNAATGSVTMDLAGTCLIDKDQ